MAQTHEIGNFSDVLLKIGKKCKLAINEHKQSQTRMATSTIYLNTE